MKIALLATGEEIVNGDILNTSSQAIARACLDQHLSVNMHLSVGDEQADLVSALNYLLSAHDVVIVTGGLGPTSDDRTRFALAEVLSVPLEFYEPSWERIVARLQHFGLDIPPNNRQQALFPKDAIVFQNRNGTADGCAVTYQNRWIYLLPGPPAECLPLLREYVLPHLLTYSDRAEWVLLRWRLFNVSEGGIAGQLETLLKDDLEREEIHLGYRIDYPYLELKCPAKTKEQALFFKEKIESFVQPHFLVDPYQKASEIFLKHLERSPTKILISDEATGGALETIVHRPSHHAHLRFVASADFKPDVLCEIRGLSTHWDQVDRVDTTLMLTWKRAGQESVHTFTIPYRRERTPLFAVEKACAVIYELLVVGR